MPTPTCSRRAALQALIAAPALAQTPATHRDTIHLDSRHQTIDNFSASDCWSMQKLGAWSDPARNRVADLLFSQTHGIGLSCWRFNLGGGLTDRINNPWRTAETFETAEGQYDWSRQKPERWFLAAAKARGVPQFLAFVNSPPGRMTRSGITYGNPGPDTTNLKPGYEPQFARYLADILHHFRTNPDRAERIDFDYISPINEPNIDWNGRSQEGSRASNADIKAVVRALHAELKRRKLKTRISAPEVNAIRPLLGPAEEMTRKYKAPYGNYLDDFLNDPEIAPLLDGRFCYHDYGSDLLKGQLLEDRQALRAKMAAYPGWKLWMSEYCVMTGSQGRGGNRRDLTMETALDVARIIHLDLTVAGVTAWHWWTAASGVNYKDGLIHTDWKKPGDAESILPARLLWALGNYSRFLRPGHRRIELQSSTHAIDGLMGSAYVDDSNRRVAAVYVNMAAAPQTLQLDFQAARTRWRLQSVTPYITSDRAGDELKAYQPLGPSEAIHLPARSVTTLIAQFR